ncbi:unnamed protein product [Timema podura]|uniref:Uncharacterized protein n=1 Tax=Timema podura TaxID=61482 RepID=A0ABN7NP52_TIMPD|nr:unnamed protein product [Timema podura]
MEVYPLPVVHEAVGNAFPVLAGNNWSGNLHEIPAGQLRVALQHSLRLSTLLRNSGCYWSEFLATFPEVLARSSALPDFSVKQWVRNGVSSAS